MHERSLYDSVEAFIARLESDQARPPGHIVRIDIYRLHLDRAINALERELARWKDAQYLRSMRPSDMSEDAAELVCDALKRASLCAFLPTEGSEDYAASGVIVIDEAVGESGVVSVADQTLFTPAEAVSRNGRS